MNTLPSLPVVSLIATASLCATLAWAGEHPAVDARSAVPATPQQANERFYLHPAYPSADLPDSDHVMQPHPAVQIHRAMSTGPQVAFHGYPAHPAMVPGTMPVEDSHVMSDHPGVAIKRDGLRPDGDAARRFYGHPAGSAMFSAPGLDTLHREAMRASQPGGSAHAARGHVLAHAPVQDRMTR